MSNQDDVTIRLIRESATKCLDIWLKTGNDDDDEHSSIHSACRAVWIDQQGKYQACNGSDFDISHLVNGSNDARGSSAITIKSVDRVHAGNDQTAATVLATVNGVCGWMVLLEESPMIWTCISAAFGPLQEAYKPSPQELAAVRTCAWDGYVASNRMCDGSRMAPYLHPDFRLTFVKHTVDASPESHVMIIPKSDFLEMVTDRYQRQPHADYAHLRDDPLVAHFDEWISAIFATPNVAMVKLKVGHPPLLWTDVLTCIKGGPSGEWVIVHKSSCSEPLLADEKAGMSSMKESG